MRLFTHDIKSSIAIPQLRDYLLESDVRIKGLHDYIEHTNPNYILINKLDLLTKTYYLDYGEESIIEISEY